MIPQGSAPRQPGMPNANMGANGQAMNRGSILSGLARDSQVNANTGTATGDRAVQDFSKGQMYQNLADSGRKVDTQNAKTHTAMQQQQEAATQMMRQADMQRFQQMNQQATSQSQLGLNLQQQNWDMWLERQRSLASLLQ